MPWQVWSRSVRPFLNTCPTEDDYNIITFLNSEVRHTVAKFPSYFCQCSWPHEPHLCKQKGSHAHLALQLHSGRVTAFQFHALHYCQSCTRRNSYTAVSLNHGKQVCEYAELLCTCRFEHPIKGQGIYAYVSLAEGQELEDGLKKELIQTVRGNIGAFAAPDVIHWAPGLPKTRSGKIMRRVSSIPLASSSPAESH